MGLGNLGPYPYGLFYVRSVSLNLKSIYYLLKVLQSHHIGLLAFSVYIPRQGEVGREVCVSLSLRTGDEVKGNFGDWKSLELRKKEVRGTEVGPSV